MSDQVPDERPSPAQKLFGGILMAFGVLIASLSGLCTLGGLAVFGLNSPSRDILPGLTMVLAVGAPPLLVGLGLVWLGRRLMRPKP